MWSVSPQWEDLTEGAHEALCDVQVWLQDLPTASPAVISGTYRSALDSAMVRSSMELTLDGQDGALLPVSPTDPLAPYGAQVSVQQTLRAGGWQETVPLGKFVLDDPQPEGSWIDHHGRALRVGDTVRVQCPDLLQRLAETPIRGLVQPKPSATVATEIDRLCRGIVPADTSMIATTALVGKGMVYDPDRLATVQQLAGLAGRIPRANRAGVVEFPTVERAAAAAHEVTVARRRWIDSVVEQSRDGVTNAVEVIGADPGNGRPVRGWAETRGGPYGTDGPMGARIRQVTSDLVRSTAAANTMAATELAKDVASRQVRFTVRTLWNPAVDVLDTHTVTVIPDRVDGDDRVRVRALVVGVEWSIAGGPMSITYAAPREEVAPWI